MLPGREGEQRRRPPRGTERSAPDRFLEITTGKGPMDAAYLAGFKEEYAKAIRDLAMPIPAGD